MEFEKKNWFVCTLWLSVHMKSVVEQGFFHKFAVDNKALKNLLNFESVENVQSSNVVEIEFKLCHISSNILRNEVSSCYTGRLAVSNMACSPCCTLIMPVWIWLQCTVHSSSFIPTWYVREVFLLIAGCQFCHALLSVFLFWMHFGVTLHSGWSL